MRYGANKDGETTKAGGKSRYLGPRYRKFQNCSHVCFQSLTETMARERGLFGSRASPKLASDACVCTRDDGNLTSTLEYYSAKSVEKLVFPIIDRTKVANARARVRRRAIFTAKRLLLSGVRLLLLLSPFFSRGLRNRACT